MTGSSKCTGLGGRETGIHLFGAAGICQWCKRSRDDVRLEECGIELGELGEEVLLLRKFREAIIDACVVDWVYTAEHEKDPKKAINDLLCMAQRIALDPAVSKEAADLRDTYKIDPETLAEAAKEACAQVADKFAEEADPSKHSSINQRDAEARYLGFLVSGNIANDIRKLPSAALADVILTRARKGLR